MDDDDFVDDDENDDNDDDAANDAGDHHYDVYDGSLQLNPFFRSFYLPSAVPGSLIFMTMVVTNPYAGLLADKYGHRQVIFVGGVISSLAILASSFATDFTMLTITYGLVGGQ